MLFRAVSLILYLEKEFKNVEIKAQMSMHLDLL
jgi:hypothetical protein